MIKWRREEKKLSLLSSNKEEKKITTTSSAFDNRSRMLENETKKNVTFMLRIDRCRYALAEHEHLVDKFLFLVETHVRCVKTQSIVGLRRP